MRTLIARRDHITHNSQISGPNFLEKGNKMSINALTVFSRAWAKATHAIINVSVSGAVALTGSLALSGAVLVTGCNSTERVPVNLNMLVCAGAIAAVHGEGVESLPPDFRPIPENPIDLYFFKLCAFWTGDFDDGFYVQWNCTGLYYEVHPPLEEPATLSIDRSDVHIEKFVCDELLVATAHVETSTTETHLDATLLLPNHRVMPDRSAYSQLVITADGVDVPTRGDYELDSGTELRIAGPFDLAAHYAANIGVRTLDFKVDGSAWHIEIDPNFAVMAVYRDGKPYDARILFQPTP